MNRRSFLQTAVCIPAGLFLTGNGLAQALGLLSPGNVVKLRCLGNIEGPRFLVVTPPMARSVWPQALTRPTAGRYWTLAKVPLLSAVSATSKDRAFSMVTPPIALPIWLQIPTRPTGTSWQAMGAGQGAIALRCLGDIEGPRFLDGQTAHGTVGLAPNTRSPYTGTRWAVF